jgi:hypothetical protein
MKKMEITGPNKTGMRKGTVLQRSVYSQLLDNSMEGSKATYINTCNNNQVQRSEFKLGVQFTLDCGTNSLALVMALVIM